MAFDGVEFDHRAAFPVAGEHISKQVDGVGRQEADDEPIEPGEWGDEVDQKPRHKRSMCPGGAMREAEHGREVYICKFDPDGGSNGDKYKVEKQ